MVIDASTLSIFSLLAFVALMSAFGGIGIGLMINNGKRRR